jgi:kynureninase
VNCETISPFQRASIETDCPSTKGIARYIVGTQPIASLSLLEFGLDTFADAEKLCGMSGLQRNQSR